MVKSGENKKDILCFRSRKRSLATARRLRIMQLYVTDWAMELKTIQTLFWIFLRIKTQSQPNQNHVQCSRLLTIPAGRRILIWKGFF